jgi:rfaE bifunctional protein nucleotidyltransferase chain/domain
MIFTNGCFDILHVGHVCYLEMARKLGDYLVVGLNADHSVRELKGRGRPINDERSRARVLAGLASVDYVVIFGTKRVTPVLKRLRPEIYVKGGDYTEESLNAEERKAVYTGGGKIKILPVWEGYSTTKTIRRMKR